MTDDVNRWQVAEEGLDKVQDILDEGRRVLAKAEEAQIAVGRVRTNLGKLSKVVLVCALIAVAVAVSRRLR
jgi:hypothetical protein